MTFTHAVRPRYDEVDMQGLVFNSHWLSYFDEASMRMLEAIGHTASSPLDDFEASVVRAEVVWKGPARLDDRIEIDVDASRFGTSSFDLHYLARVAEREVCEATVTYVSVDRSTHRSRPIPESIRHALAASSTEVR